MPKMISAIDIQHMNELNFPQPTAAVDPSYWQPHLVPADKGYPQGGTKFDQGKPRMDLLDAVALEGLAQVLTFGAQKYAAHNWRGGLAYSRLVASMLRHLGEIQKGNYVDDESGLPHIDHLGCCWMFLSNMMATRPDMNDLWKPNENRQGSTS